MQRSWSTRIGANGGDDLQTPQFMLERLEQWGSPTSYPHYAVGWAHAMSTPYQWTKQIASHWGGTRTGALVHWPRGIRSKGELRAQFCHVIDVAPTILAAAGLPEPTQVHGVTQEPMHGVSMSYSFEDPTQPERHETQYFEIFGNRGIYHRGWSAVTAHRPPWEYAAAPQLPFDDDTWELYDGASDWTQARDLALAQPERLRELRRLFLIEAARYGVFPLDDRIAERLDAARAGRPVLVQRKSQLLFEGMGQLSENCVLDLKNRSHAITAQVRIPAQGAQGVLLNQGGAPGGWALYVADGCLTYCYAFVGIERYRIASARPLEPGEHQLRLEFAYDGGGAGKGGTVTLYVDGCSCGSGRVERTHMTQFSFDETMDVGRDTGSPVSLDYPARDNAFSGTIHWIRIDIGEDDHSHLVPAERTYGALLSRQ